jgi:hypothetical protein
MDRRAGAVFVAAAMIAAPALAQVVRARTVFRSTSLPAGAAKTETVRCPRGSVAASAGVSSAAPGVVLLRAQPQGTGAYAFLVGNPAGNQARRATVAVACRRLSPRGAVFKLTLLSPRTLQVPAGSRRSASLSCPSSAAAAGAGFDLAPGRRASGSRSRLSIPRMTAGVRSFSFTVRNSSSVGRQAVLGGSCLTVVSQAHAVQRRLHVKLTTFPTPVDPGRRTITRTCPRGWFSFAARYGLLSPGVAIEAAAAVDHGATWVVANSSDGPARVDLQLACGRVLP